MVNNLLNVDELLATIAKQLKPYINDAHIIGIQTGGLMVAEKLAQILHYAKPISRLNISFYRDDFTKIGLHPEVNPSQIIGEVEGKTIVLIDDVLHTGRTIRAALNEIFDYGRPARVILVILVNRQDNELPIAPDICGLKLQLNSQQEIKLSNNNGELKLQVIDIE